MLYLLQNPCPNNPQAMHQLPNKPKNQLQLQLLRQPVHLYHRRNLLLLTRELQMTRVAQTCGGFSLSSLHSFFAVSVASSYSVVFAGERKRGATTRVFHWKNCLVPTSRLALIQQEKKCRLIWMNPVQSEHRMLVDVLVMVLMMLVQLERQTQEEGLVLMLEMLVQSERQMLADALVLTSTPPVQSVPQMREEERDLMLAKRERFALQTPEDALVLL
mmetsp:Transcript_24223/g.26895  ORF Transcript_24223/g.26895 Transcript_24223/m.26895 type:complete len:217 (-) Transcript_24223:389-1039(-)